jgi:hypothetical protein
MSKEQLNDLKAHLAGNPQIKKVFFNADGDWTFHTAKGSMDIEHSSEEVQGDDFTGPTTEEVAKAKAPATKGKAGKAAPVKDDAADLQ